MGHGGNYSPSHVANKKKREENIQNAQGQGRQDRSSGDQLPAKAKAGSQFVKGLTTGHIDGALFPIV